MRNLLALTITIGLLSTTSILAQHGERIQHGDNAPHGERVEKIIEIIGGPGTSHGSFDCNTSSQFNHRSDHVMMMTQLLDLTEEQQAQLKKMQLEFDLKLVDAQAALKKANLKLKALMSGDEVGKSKVFSAIDKVADREADLKKMQYANKLDMHSILTKEQLEKAKQLPKGSGGDHKVMQWHGDRMGGSQRLIEFHGEGTTIDDDGNVFIIKKEIK